MPTTRPQFDRRSVLQAIAECDRIGRAEFLQASNFKQARKFYLMHNGRGYDTKAIAGVAHRYVTDERLEWDDFSGGEALVKRFRDLGFEVTGDDKWQWDELLLACDLLHLNAWQPLRESDERVAALSSFLRSQSPISLYIDDFRSSSSVHHKLEDLRTAHPGRVGQGQPTKKGGELTAQMAAAFVANPDQMHANAQELWASGSLGLGDSDGLVGTPDGAPSEVNSPDSLTQAIEGRVRQRLVKTRERSGALRSEKIAQARERRGTIACETCDFDFEVVYGELGAGFIHVHHVVPLHFSGEVETTLEHLVLLCANCHQMIHRGQSWKTPEELRGIILASRAPTNSSPTEFGG